MKILIQLILLLLTVPIIHAHDVPLQTGHTHDILEVKFNRDATRLISYSAGDAWLILWDVQSGRQLWRTRTDFIQKAKEYYTLTCFAFNRDESLIASGSGNGTIQLWDAQTGKPLWRADAHSDSVTAVAFSPDGKTILSAASPKEGEDEIKALNVTNGQISKSFQGRSCTIAAMSFSPDGKTLRTGNLDGIVSEWDMDTGMQHKPQSVQPCRVRRTYNWETSYTSDLLITAKRTAENELSLIDTQTGNTIKTFETNGEGAQPSKISGDGKTIIYEKSGNLMISHLKTGANRQIDQFSIPGFTIDLSHDGRLFAEGGRWGDAAIKITDTQTGRAWFLNGHPSEVKALAYTPDGKYLAVAGSDRNIYFFNAANHTLVKILSNHTEPVYAIAFSPDGKLLLSSSENGDVLLWKWEVNTEPIAGTKLDIREVKKIAFSPDSSRFSILGDGEIDVTVADTQSCKVIRSFGIHKDYRETHGDIGVVYGGVPISDIAFAKDDHALITNHYDHTLHFWNIDSGELSKSVNLKDRLSFMQLSQDNKTIVAAAEINDGYRIKLINTNTGKIITEFDDKDTCCIETLILSPDGKHFATSDVLGDVLLWSIHKKKPLRQFYIDGSDDDAIAFSPDGKTLAVGGKNQNLFLFDVITGNKLWQLLPSYEPTELEMKLNKEKEERQKQMDQIQAQRDKQAAIDLKILKKQVYITFDHYGEMINPLKLKMQESDKPNKSAFIKSENDAGTIWLRLHNDSSLPIDIPAQNMFLPYKTCTYSDNGNQQFPGLCNNAEIIIEFRLEDKKGKILRYSTDLVSSAYLLPKTAALFTVSKNDLKENTSLNFEYVFLKENDAHEMAKYGRKITLKFSESDLRKKKSGKPVKR